MIFKILLCDVYVWFKYFLDYLIYINFKILSISLYFVRFENENKSLFCVIKGMKRIG